MLRPAGSYRQFIFDEYIGIDIQTYNTYIKNVFWYKCSFRKLRTSFITDLFSEVAFIRNMRFCNLDVQRYKYKKYDKIVKLW